MSPPPATVGDGNVWLLESKIVEAVVQISESIDVKIGELYIIHYDEAVSLLSKEFYGIESVKNSIFVFR